MKRRTAVLTGAIACALASVAYAMGSVRNEGTWPTNWPKELEPLRKQSRTYLALGSATLHYAISFANQDEFESAWPHLLKLKTKGAPIFLERGPNFFLGDHAKAGVVVHAPPASHANNPAFPEAPIPGLIEPRVHWSDTTYLEVVVDGAVIDLNRIPLPADTPIIDERFKSEPNK